MDVARRVVCGDGGTAPTKIKAVLIGYPGDRVDTRRTRRLKASGYGLERPIRKGCSLNPPFVSPQAGTNCTSQNGDLRQVRGGDSGRIAPMVERTPEKRRRCWFESSSDHHLFFIGQPAAAWNRRLPSSLRRFAPPLVSPDADGRLVFPRPFGSTCQSACGGLESTSSLLARGRNAPKSRG